MIAHLSDGCMRDAVKYLDQISVMGSVDEASVGKFLGVVSDTLISKFVILYGQLQHDANKDIAYIEIVDFVTGLSGQGIDLTLFPKQLMTYTDTHFATDPALYSQISQFASTLISQSKRYPHPLVMYKTLLFQQATGVEEVQEVTKVAKVKEIAKVSP
jgi:DNA polymerase III gamma/tau subunit